MIRPSSAVSDVFLRAKLPLEVGALHVTTDFTNPERSGGLPARGQARMRRSVNAMLCEGNAHLYCYFEARPILHVEMLPLYVFTNSVISASGK